VAYTQLGLHGPQAAYGVFVAKEATSSFIHTIGVDGHYSLTRTLDAHYQGTTTIDGHYTTTRTLSGHAED